MSLLHIPASQSALLKRFMHNTGEKKGKKRPFFLIQGFESAPAYLISTPKREKVIDSVSADKMPPVIFSDISLCWK